MIKNKNACLGIGCFYFAIATCLGVVCPNFLWAQVDSAKIKQLNEIQIKAKKINLLQSSPTPVQNLGGDDLKRLSSLSVADAIRYFSGVQLKDYGGIGGLKTINVRSMGSNHTAVFYDGIQLGNAQNGQVDLGKFSLDNIEEVTLYSGQKSALLMPAKAYASASALYIKTPVPKFEPNQNHYFKASLKSGSFDFINPSFNYTQKLSKKLSFNLSTEILNASGKYKYRYTNGVYDTTVTRTNTDIFAKRMEAGLYGLTADSSKWQVKLYNYNSERGVPGAIVANKFNFSQRQWDDNFFLQSSYQSKENKHYQYLFNAKYAYDFTRYLDPDRISLNGPLNNKYTQQETYFSFANQYQIDTFWVISLSADYSFQKLDANLQSFAYPSRNTTLIAFANTLRWPRFNVQANLLATIINDKVKTNIPAGNKAAYTPTIMASWQPFNTANLRIRAFYKSIFRMPTFNDLYYTFIGNSTLKPEYATQYDLGITFSKSFTNVSLQSISIQTDAYYNQVTDKIVAVPTLNLFRWTMLNLGKVSIKGIETNVQSLWQFGEIKATAKMGYTFEKALDVTPTGNSYKQQIPYIPVQSASILLGADWKSFGLNYSYIFTGERYSQKANIPENYVPAWFTHDLSLQKNIIKNKINYRIAAEVNNLLNQYYDVVLNYPMPGRNYRLTLSADF
ncbi:TonB-dependent receptor [Pedobacter changchengzhani]|uniref:TonB-dependent receptor n=1 Tax=Pedobacter changchengzhani TaxID=2529274 RepID=A0A4R5MHI2_9SPHI|nr:TonB-dependent receptor [Pedobacter changchengzhani]TDG34988.1 TonB-dependent receptor [Pedobacter changchengzhani]